MPDLADAYRVLDERLLAAVAMAERQRKVQSPCARGCAHCCYEPVYAERTEVEYLLDQITPEQRSELAIRTAEWSERFWASGLGSVDFHRKGSGFGPLLKYRALKLSCPVLQGNVCLQYPLRPSSCRSHVAIMGASRCSRDELRPKQIFLTAEATFAGTSQVFAAIGMESGTRLFEFDHLGVWLSHFLLSDKRRSGSAANQMISQTDPHPSLNTALIRDPRT